MHGGFSLRLRLSLFLALAYDGLPDSLAFAVISQSHVYRWLLGQESVPDCVVRD